MDSITPQKKLEKWPLDKLKPHPMQERIFDKPTPDEIKDLADQIKANGMTPIEALPDGTIICGHSRVLVAKELGWTDVEVWVREDLEAQGSDAVALRLVKENRCRRQLSPLADARCLKVAYELEKKQKSRGTDKGTLRDRIAKKYNMSGRSLDRYLNVLEAPIEVQTAFDEKKLTLIEASRIAGLLEEQRNEITTAIRKGDDPQRVLARILGKKKKNLSSKVQPTNAVADYLRPLSKWKNAMQNRMGEIDCLRPIDVRGLKEARSVIDELLQKSTEKADAAAKGISEQPAFVDPGMAALYDTSMATNPLLREVHAKIMAEGSSGE